MYTTEDSEMLIRMQFFKELPAYNSQNQGYKLIPISDPENSFLAFDVELKENSYEEKKNVQKTIKKN